MKIITDNWAVFWSPPGTTLQFHADVSAPTPAAAAAKFRSIYPQDTVHSVRGCDGRFCSLS